MSTNNDIKVQDMSELYSIIPEELRKEYAIGMHGFSDRNYLSESENGESQIDENKMQQAKSSILENGLKIKGDRKLLSTLMFGEEAEDYITSKGYPAGVIVALPKVLRSESGEEIFIGSPNEDKIIEEFRTGKRRAWDRNREATSLSEIILPSNGCLDSMFIIGTYTKTENGIEVTVNPNHIALRNGRVPDEFFKEKQDQIMEMIKYLNVNDSIIKETIEQQKNYSGKFKSSLDFRELVSNSGESNYMGNEYKLTEGIEEQKFTDFIPDLRQEPISGVSLTELGEKSYQHFGKKIAEKLKGIVNALKSKFFSKDVKEGEKNGR